MKKIRKPLIITISLLIAITINACGSVTRSSPSTFQGTSLTTETCDYGGELKSVEAIDQYTVKFTLCYPDVSFPAKIAHPAFSILDSEYLDQTSGNSTVISASPVGTGPYMLSNAIPGSNITLTRNPNYWGTPPKTNEIIFSWSEDAFQRYISVLTYIVNAADNITSEVFDLIRNNDVLQLHIRSSVSIYYIGLNNLVAPFNNRAFRQGIAQSIDRETIVSTFFPEGSVVADQFIPNEITPGFSSGVEWYAYNLDDAVASLAEVNYDYSQVFNLYYVETPENVFPDSALIAEYISETLRQNMNIKIHPQVLTEEQFLEDLSQGQLGMFLMRLDGTYADATNYYNLTFIQNGVYFGQLDVQLLEHVRVGEGLSDTVARQGQYDALNQVLKREIPIIPIGYISSALINRVTLENVIVGPYNEDFSEMGNLTDQITFMQTSEPFSLNPIDETERDTLRVASLIYNTLVSYQYGGTGLQGALADSWSSNEDMTEWTFILHYGVTYNNGAAFDANDVVATFSAIWDASNPNHTGRTGEFRIFRNCFGNFLNAQ